VRHLKIVVFLGSLLAPGVQAQRQSPPSAGPRAVIAASAIFDGAGQTLHNTRIVVQGTQIAAIDPKAGPVDYDLRGLTVLPGLIDVHAHITWSFGRDGKNAGMNRTTQEAAYQSAGNARRTLMAGFTTIQSVGSPADVALRDAIARGEVPGPRILTAIQGLQGRGEQTGTLDEIRAFVRKQKEAGADLIKIFASGGMLEGTMTLSLEQLNAACDEPRKQGLRSMVHAYREAVRAAIVAGCTEIEHGLGASDDDLKLMAERGIYFDPQDGLMVETFLQNKGRYLGTPLFDVDVFAGLARVMPSHHELLRRAARVPGLKMVFGTDAVAGTHGRNAEDLIHRVEDGVPPTAALVSASGLAAASLGMADQIGSIAPKLQADIIAVEGNPLKDMTALRRVVFVMQGGIVYKNSRGLSRTY